MILHCAPPYSLHISNPALGYLKGFLQSHGIEVRNVYWNLILDKIMTKFQRGLEKYTDSGDLFIAIPTLYIGRHLLSGDPGHVETPLDAVYLSLYSREELSDMIQTVKDDIDRYIMENSLDKDLFSGFTFKTSQWLISYYIIRRLKESNPDATIVVGGIFNESQAVAFMRIFPEIDFAIWGEGEYPLLHLVEALKENYDVKDTSPRTAFRKGNHLVATKISSENPPLDSYPFADHSDYVETYKKYAVSRPGQEFGIYSPDQIPVSLPIWGSRSCPWNRCKFCILNEEYTYRTRSPENIVQEIEFQSQKHDIDTFIFVDTELPGNLSRFKTLLKLLIQSSARREREYHFFAEVSPVFVDPETAHLMKLASFSQIQIGFEAMTDSLLKKMDKRHRFAHTIQALKLGNRYGLEVRGLNIIRGTPSETREDILESCANLKFLRFLLSKYTLDPVFLRLEKGSPFFKEVPEEEREEWNSNNFWTEIEPLQVMPESERYTFFGFTRSRQERLWGDFESLLKFYTQQHRSCEWVEYPTGSFVEEKGLRFYKYIFDRDETDVLIFCDTIKTFSEIRERFPALPEEKIREIMSNLKEVGFIYYNENADGIISVLEAERRKILNPP